MIELLKETLDYYLASSDEMAKELEILLKIYLDEESGDYWSWFGIRDEWTLMSDGESNIGVNNGVDAGQTIMHMHIHLIPRYHDDVPNPRGGVRGVIPGKQDY